MNFVPPTAAIHLNYVDDTEQENMTPESVEHSLDGGQNYTAAEAFVQGLASLVNQSDVETMIRAQKQMLQRFEKTNEMLLNCNALSQSRLKGANEDFKKHVKLLSEMKKDLDYIFRKIRIIKQKLNSQYPEAFSEALQRQRSSLAEEAEDESEENAATVVETTANVEAAANDEHVTETRKSVAFVEAEEQKIPASAENKNTTVEYVQMDEAADNGKPIENELIKRVCSIETTNPNDSSDCTSEDTG